MMKILLEPKYRRTASKKRPKMQQANPNGWLEAIAIRGQLADDLLDLHANMRLCMAAESL